MNSLFHNAFNFNQDLSNWDVSSVIDMSYMFSGASNFNNILADWKFNDDCTIENIFYHHLETVDVFIGDNFYNFLLKKKILNKFSLKTVELASSITDSKQALVKILENNKNKL